MARKINFDPPAADAPAQRAEMHEAAPQRSRPLLGLDRPIKQSTALGAISKWFGVISEKLNPAEKIERKPAEAQGIAELNPPLLTTPSLPTPTHPPTRHNPPSHHP